ncbi:ABC transporter ATP-binding protein, partial [Staphylococcus arlettae]
MTVLNITNLTKRFGKFKVLDGIDLKLQPGEIFGFIGPNGAGKSTTLQIILGVLTPSSGNIEIFGIDALTEVVTIHEHLAFVPGDVNLWPNLTGGEVIDFFLSLHKHANYAKKERLIEQFDLDISKKCGTYSKGNRQKVALIAALSIDAELYI